MRFLLVLFAFVVNMEGQAAETLFGSSDAMACYQAATISPKFADDESCNDAIAAGNLTQSELAATYSNRGIIRASHGRIDKAIEDQNAAIRLVPQSAQAHVNRANAYSRAKRHQEALTDYDQAIALSSGALAPAYYNRSLTYKALGNNEAAQKDLQQAATLAPEAYKRTVNGP